MRTDHAETLDVNSKFVALVTLFFFSFLFCQTFFKHLITPKFRFNKSKAPCKESEILHLYHHLLCKLTLLFGN